MNNYSYPFVPPSPNNMNMNVIEELIKINETLKRIEKLLSKQQSAKQVNNYLEKDDNFYMV